VLVFEEAVDFMDDFDAHFWQVDEHIRQRLADAFQRAQCARQQLGGFFAHIGNAQGAARDEVDECIT